MTREPFPWQWWLMLLAICVFLAVLGSLAWDILAFLFS